MEKLKKLLNNISIHMDGDITDITTRLHIRIDATDARDRITTMILDLNKGDIEIAQAMKKAMDELRKFVHALSGWSDLEGATNQFNETIKSFELVKDNGSELSELFVELANHVISKLNEKKWIKIF